MITTTFNIISSIGVLQMAILVTYFNDKEPQLNIIDLTFGGLIKELNQGDNEIVVA